MAKPKATVSVIFPGRELTLKCGLKAKVFPLGLVHLKKFSKALTTTVMSIAQSMKLTPGANSKTIGEQVLTEALPYMTEDLFGLLTECVEIHNPDPNGEVISLEDLPHWEIPPIIQAWFEESFDDESKWRPWMTAFTKMKDLAKNVPSITTR